MPRITPAIDRKAAPTPVKVKTGGDALEFYRAKTTWLDPKKLAGIERLRREKRRSLRS